MARISMIVWNDFRNDARVLKEAQTLQAAGHEVTVFALHTPGVTKASETLASGIKVTRVLRSPLWLLRSPANPQKQTGAVSPKQANKGPVGQALRIATRSLTHCVLLVRMLASRPDAIHSHDVNTLPTAWLASVFTRTPLVYDAHEISTDREGYAKLRSLVGWVEKKLMPRAAATITTTDARAKFFARAYRIPRPVVLQNRPRLLIEKRSDRLRRELELEMPWPIVLYQGGLQQGRGLARLVDAAGMIERAYFVFMGGGRLAQSLERQAIDAGLSERVRFIPTVSLDDLPGYTASADIGVQPIENTCLNHLTTDSNKLFEYMMAGLAVVASGMPEIRAIVNRYEFGITVPPGDTEALAQAIRTLVDNPDLRAGCAANAVQAAKTVNWEEQEMKLVSLYKGVFRT